MKLLLTLGFFGACASGMAQAAPVAYSIDPGHTYPSFEADHMGLSLWRGKFTRTSGKLIYDKATGTGTVEVNIDPASADFGNKVLNIEARGPALFEVKKYPKAGYQGKLEGFIGNGPAKVTGALTLHGVTRPVDLSINFFKCMQHPIFKRDWCGADAQATINREDFGMAGGKDYGFKMEVVLHIQVEAIEAPPSDKTPEKK